MAQLSGETEPKAQLQLWAFKVGMFLLKGWWLHYLWIKRNGRYWEGFLCCVSVKAGSISLTPFFNKEKKNLKQEVHFLDMNRPKAQTLPLWASPASVLSLCTYHLRIFRDTEGISSTSRRQKNCLLLVSMLCGTEMQFLVYALLIKSSLKLLHCSHFLEGTLKTTGTITYTAQLARPCSTFVWPGRTLNLCYNFVSDLAKIYSS